MIGGNKRAPFLALKTSFKRDEMDRKNRDAQKG
jgi:hypothetical protein